MNKFKKTLIIGISEAALSSEYWSRLKATTETIVTLQKNSPDIESEIINSDCVLVNFGVDVKSADINSAKNLKYIGVLATAFGKVDVNAAASRNVTVTNLPGYSTNSVAEFTIAVLLEQLRTLEAGKLRTRSGQFTEDGFSAREIRGKSFGIVGLGHIGCRVAELAQGFGAKVIYWSRNRRKHLESSNFEFATLEKLFSSSDFISLNLAHTKDTDKIINESLLKTVRSETIIINTAPNEIIDFEALDHELLKNNFTYIFDHSDEMSEDNLKRLSTHSNCIIYPPIAYISKEARASKQEMFVGNIENFLKGDPSNVVEIERE